MLILSFRQLELRTVLIIIREFGFLQRVICFWRRYLMLIQEEPLPYFCFLPFRVPVRQEKCEL
jgi:hypothetical protein